MNFKYPILGAFLLFCLSTFGQNLSFDPNPADAYGSPDEIRKAQGTLTNNSSSSVDLSWKRVTNDKPDSWETSVCDANLCYGSDQDEPTMTFTLAPGASTPFFVQFDGRNQIEGTFPPEFDPVPGTGYVAIVIYAPSDSAGYNLFARFNGDLTPTGISASLESQINLFPNPVRANLYLEAPVSAKLANAEIYNIVGKKVKSVTVSPNQTKSSIDVSELQEGIYFIRLLDQQNSLIATRRINKIN